MEKLKNEWKWFTFKMDLGKIGQIVEDEGTLVHLGYLEEMKYASLF